MADLSDEQFSGDFEEIDERAPFPWTHDNDQPQAGSYVEDANGHIVAMLGDPVVATSLVQYMNKMRETQPKPGFWKRLWQALLAEPATPPKPMEYAFVPYAKADQMLRADEGWRILNPSEAAALLAKHQPCGCIVCTCEDDLRCHGCGAKNCGTHPVGQIPNAVYEQQPAQPESGEVKRYVGRITELEPCPVQYVVLASDFDRLQSALTAAQQRIADLESENAGLRTQREGGR
jgi:hypothetical protein